MSPLSISCWATSGGVLRLLVEPRIQQVDVKGVREAALLPASHVRSVQILNPTLFDILNRTLPLALILNPEQSVLS